jgi:hypothetical protein
VASDVLPLVAKIGGLVVTLLNLVVSFVGEEVIPDLLLLVADLIPSIRKLSIDSLSSSLGLGV